MGEWYRMGVKWKAGKREYEILLLLVLAGFGFRILLACQTQGFLSDISCFYNWSLRVHDVGFAGFYADEYFADYPPGYLYVSYLLGAALRFFHSAFLSPSCLLILKLPAILCDMVIGILLYCIAKRKNIEVRGGAGVSGCLFAALFLWNPAIFQNSAIWGQVDSVYTLILLVMCLFLYDRKMIPAYFAYVVGVLMKPQMIVFTPLLLWGIYENVFADGICARKLLHNLLGGLAAIGCMLLACLPFGIERVYTLYFNTMTSYPYVSVNAYNFWTMWGLDWKPQEELLFGILSYQKVGSIIIGGICICAIWLFWRRKNCKDRYWMVGAFIMATMFLFSVRMHERYFYPVLVLLLLIYLTNHDRRFLICYIWFSVFFYWNCWHVLYYFTTDFFYTNSILIRGISAAMVLGGVYFYRSVILCRIDELSEAIPERACGRYETKDWQTDKTDDISCSGKTGWSFHKIEWLAIVGLVALYSIFAFYQLGDRIVPNQEFHAEINHNILLTMPENQGITKIGCYLNYDAEVPLYLYEWDTDAEQWNYVQEIVFPDMYKWNMVLLDTTVNTRNLCLVTDGVQRNLAELVFCDREEHVIVPENAQDYPGLFDEQKLFPGEVTYMSGTYFDEIYYARVAHEFENGLPTYEWTHPPFGKIMIAFGAKLFGKTPFGFRFMGAFFGCLMLPFVYLLGRNICQSRALGFFAAFLFAFDFMHFTQTRIATIDVYITFFVILMYFFMERYLHRIAHTRETQKRDGKTILFLLGAGISFGFGVASKWTGFYAGAGLAVLFFGDWVVAYGRTQESLRISEEQREVFYKKFLQTCGICLIGFIGIPILIYTFSYIPFRNQQTDMGLVSRMIQNQKDIFGYHTGMMDAHPFASSWKQWPGMVRPILYFSSYAGNGMARGISAFGNPLIWWVGIPALLYMIYLMIRKRDTVATFLFVAYFAQYLPWMLVSRCTFIYHYFPCVPFVVLMITYGMHQLTRGIQPRYRRLLFISYGILVFALFWIYYPVLSGQPIDRQYAKETLQILKDWVLVN